MYPTRVRMSDDARCQSAWYWSYRRLWASWLGCWQLNFFLLEEQQAPLTVEPSPQSLQNSLSHLIWLEFQLPAHFVMDPIVIFFFFFPPQEFIFVGPWDRTVFPKRICFSSGPRDSRVILIHCSVWDHFPSLVIKTRPWLDGGVERI